ncbi:MAG: heparinase II/III family protein, partial [Planctomycetaceae bacterium]
VRRREVIRSLEPAAQAIADLTHPDDRISLFNDAGLNMAYLPSECLDAFESLGGTQRAARSRFGFESSGFYGARFKAGYVLFDAGPSCCDSLPAHGHGDILAFEWTIGSQRVVVDAGVREYEIGPEREWNRSTRAHNTVTVGDRDQCEFIRNFRVGHRAHGRCEQVDFEDDSIYVRGCYTAVSADGQVVEHSREFTATDNEIRVVDDLKSKTSEPAVARLLLHHDCMLQATQDGLKISIGEHEVCLTSASPVKVVEAKWSPDFGTEFPTKQIEIHYGMTPCTGEFTLRVETETD